MRSIHLIFLIVSVKCIDCARILGVFLTPSYSHQIVYQPIWKELSLRGHNVTVITPNPLRDPSLTNLTEIDVSNYYKVLDDEINPIFAQEKSTLNEIKRLSAMYTKLTMLLFNHTFLQDLMKNHNASIDLLLVEYLYLPVYALKDVFDCPMIGITSLGLTAFSNELIGNPKNPAVDPELYMSVSYLETFTERLLSLFCDIVGRITARLTMKSWDGLLSQFINKPIRSLYDITRDFSLVIVNSNFAIRSAKPSVPNLIDISAIHISKPKPLPPVLNEFLNNATEGAIYFSLGTNVRSMVISDDKLNNILEAFSELPYKVLWKFEQNRVKKLPDNVRIQKWLPQWDILNHPNIKLTIMQGGIQSIDEALASKVPMLFIPIFGDQHSNAHRMVSQGAAISLDYDTMSKTEIKTAILNLINDPRYKNRVEELSAIASDQIVPPLDKAVWWIEYVLRHDGAKHLRYKGRDVPFYQFYMLDILIFCSATIYSLWFLLRTLKLLIPYQKSRGATKREKIKKIE